MHGARAGALPATSVGSRRTSATAPTITDQLRRRTPGVPRVLIGQSRRHPTPSSNFTLRGIRRSLARTATLRPSPETTVIRKPATRCAMRLALGRTASAAPPLVSVPQSVSSKRLALRETVDQAGLGHPALSSGRLARGDQTAQPASTVTSGVMIWASCVIRHLTGDASNGEGTRDAAWSRWAGVPLRQAQPRENASSARPNTSDEQAYVRT
ncbi:MAG: hypothetical protein QOG01_3345 [Pseudonocardiales bacterium]|jgi:hypothetical protein|nr:hypothetical protein [Pseudonocardiales bacterium]